ncbi:MAG: deoxyribodipyrimidine photo-lyase [Thermoplasmatota archaeon]
MAEAAAAYGAVPDIRVRVLPTDAQGGKADGPVVYWCRTARRMTGNPALQHAAQRARAAGVGLWVLETCRTDRPYAAPRFDAWVEQGMADNAAALAKDGIPHRAVFAPAKALAELLATATKGASLLVTDDHPLRRPGLPSSVTCRAVAVEGNGLLPLAATPRTWPAAVHLRRFIMRNLADHLWWPAARPCEGADGAEPTVDGAQRPPGNGDQAVGEVDLEGGARAGKACLDDFVARLDGYLDASHPDAHAASGLSPYLHYGHVGAHEVAGRILAAEDWNPGRITNTNGSKGWWGLGEAAEAFMDQLVTWRELGFVDCHHRPDNTAYAAQPEWARATLAAHADDPRTTYDAATLEAAETDDEVWNAAQRQLTRTGMLHNHLRMLWGKRILEWSPGPEEAWRLAFHLNDRWALDGRDPNSVSGIAWVFGRFDRGWQERDVYGKVRTMSSERTRKKLRMEGYLATYGPDA